MTPWKVKDEPKLQRNLYCDIRVSALPASPTIVSRDLGLECRGSHPHCKVPSIDQAIFVFFPIRHTILRLVAWMDS